jgi:hypothetical protein
MGPEVIARASYAAVRALVAKREPLIIRPQDDFFALSIDGEMVSMLSLSIKGERAKIKANYTRPEFRRRGYFSRLLAFVVSAYRDSELTADCLDASLGAYLAAGFSVQSRKAFKLGVITRVKKSRALSPAQA